MIDEKLLIKELSKNSVFEKITNAEAAEKLMLKKKQQKKFVERAKKWREEE